MDDASQLELLHREHAAAVRAYARRRIGPEDADDVVADVFVVAWRRLADVPAEPRTWLLGIARKALGNRRRTSRRQRALYDRLADEAGVGVTAVAPPGETGVPGDGALLRALATLAPRDREVLLLVTWDGLDHNEAGEVLGIGAGAVSMRVLRARRRLERALGRAEEHSGDGARSRSAASSGRADDAPVSTSSNRAEPPSATRGLPETTRGGPPGRAPQDPCPGPPRRAPTAARPDRPTPGAPS